jgi:hypothetical protein
MSPRKYAAEAIQESLLRCIPKPYATHLKGSAAYSVVSVEFYQDRNVALFPAKKVGSPTSGAEPESRFTGFAEKGLNLVLWHASAQPQEILFCDARLRCTQ